MNTPRALYEEIALAHGPHTVRLRPSLRAATLLEAEYLGLENLFRSLDEHSFTTFRKIISIATADRGEADALLKAVAGQPLGEIARTFHGPLTSLCLGFIPQSTQSERPHSTPAKSAPLAWAEVYQRLFKAATGWLRWTPDAAWNATPTEITAAFEEHLEMLRLIHGSAEDTTAPEPSITEEQRAQALADGLDPEFDREGLRALKARLSGGFA